MYRILLTHEVRTEHAKAIRRQRGSNDYRDKELHFREGDVMQCIGTFLVKDNLVAVEYD